MKNNLTDRVSSHFSGFFKLVLFVLLLSSLYSQAEDRIDIDKKASYSAKKVESLLEENNRNIASGNWAGTDFVIDEFTSLSKNNNGNSFISVNNKNAINNKLRCLKNLYNVDFYVVISPFPSYNLAKGGDKAAVQKIFSAETARYTNAMLDKLRKEANFNGILLTFCWETIRTFTGTNADFKNYPTESTILSYVSKGQNIKFSSKDVADFNSYSSLQSVKIETTAQRDALVKTYSYYLAKAVLSSKGENVVALTDLNSFESFPVFTSCAGNSNGLLSSADKSNLDQFAANLEKNLGIKVKINSTNVSGTSEQLYGNDASVGDIEFTVKPTDANTFTLDWNIKADWLQLSSGQNTCLNEAIRSRYNDFKVSTFYKAYSSQSTVHRIAVELTWLSYNVVFQSFYCATSEESCQGQSNTVKFTYGAIHELVATVDVLELISGIGTLLSGTGQLIADSQLSYLADMKSLYLDIRNGKSYTIDELPTVINKILPPSYRIATAVVVKIKNVSTAFWKFYITDGNYYRYGQLTVMIIPIALTAGEYLAAKVPQVGAKLALLGKKGKDVAVVLSDASKANETIIVSEAENLITIQDDAGKIVTTIEKKGDDVVINKVGKTDDLLTADGTFIDNLLEADYNKYLARKTAQGKPPRGRLDWKEARDYWLNDSPMARGNAFNKTAVNNGWYDYYEINLENGKRLDSYVPPSNGNVGEIISRKATNLEEIDLSTYESYLKEMQSKYAAGTKIRSNKYADIDGNLLQGKQILEIPSSNQSFSQIQDYIDLAKNKYNIEIRFRPE